MQLWIGGLHATHFGQNILRNGRDPVTEVNTLITQAFKFNEDNITKMFPRTV